MLALTKSLVTVPPISKVRIPRPEQYVAEFGNLLVIDIQDPMNPVAVASSNALDGPLLAVSGNVIYVTDGETNASLGKAFADSLK